MKYLNRRTVLRGLVGAGAVSVALPPLEAMFNANGTAYAASGAIPRRFGVWFWGNGNRPEQWRPTGEGEGDAWQLSEELMPFAPVNDRISVVSGMQVRVPNIIPHFSGQAGLLSAVEPLGEEGNNTWAAPSIDQVIAAEIGGETLFRSLEISALSGTSVSARGPNDDNPGENDPWRLYERLFGPAFSAPGEDVAVDPKLALRRSVLDAVMGQADALKRRVGASDKIRLDQHLAGIRDLEQRLARLQEDPPNLEACVRPAEISSTADVVALSDRHRLMGDLLIHSLACDQTRVFTNTFSTGVNNHLYPGASAGHHQLTHDELGEQPEVNSIVIQIMEEASWFVQALDAVPEGDGTLLDNCGVMFASEVSEGRTHSLDDVPLIVAGGMCGALKMGVHHRSTTRENATKVLLTLIRGMGIPVASFGEGDAMASEGLSAIER